MMAHAVSSASCGLAGRARAAWRPPPRDEPDGAFTAVLFIVGGATGPDDARELADEVAVTLKRRAVPLLPPDRRIFFEARYPDNMITAA